MVSKQKAKWWKSSAWWWQNIAQSWNGDLHCTSVISYYRSDWLHYAESRQAVIPHILPDFRKYEYYLKKMKKESDFLKNAPTAANHLLLNLLFQARVWNFGGKTKEWVKLLLRPVGHVIGGFKATAWQRRGEESDPTWNPASVPHKCPFVKTWNPLQLFPICILLRTDLSAYLARWASAGSFLADGGDSCSDTTATAAKSQSREGA